jgi:hypothetical protein
VPTWARREAAAGVDPLALRRRVTLRSGLARLTVDETGLVSRRWWGRRRRLAWAAVAGFEEQLRGWAGRIHAQTATGTVALAATRRAPAELAELHAVLDAYRRRARLLP